MLRLLSPKKTAELGFISEWQLRRLIAEGRCPGIYSGSHFKVNVDALIEQLDAQSRAAATGGAQK